MLNRFKAKSTVKRQTKFQKISLFFFNRPRFTLLIWLSVFIFGIFSYTTLLKREGFPSVQFPFTIVNATYLVNNPQKVDNDLAKPISSALLKQDKAKNVQSVAYDNSAMIFVEYEEGTDAETATKTAESIVKSINNLPAEAKIELEAPKFGFTQRGDDLVISYYASKNGTPISEIADSANRAVDFLKSQNLDSANEISIIDPYLNGVDPATGQQAVRQAGFDRYGVRTAGQNIFYDSVVIGVTRAEGADVLKFDEQLRSAVAKLNQQNKDKNFIAVVSASFAPDIKTQISELQRALLEGLLAALVIGAIVIALRASMITVIAMITVISITIAVLFLIGYTLNTITLFALILGLALIVDDTIIMVEAIDSQRRRKKNAGEAVSTATRKISRAMIAATSTAILSFAPLLFVGGILGSFIKAIPVTVIIGLATSLVVALIFIPFFAKFLMLRKNQMGEEGIHEVAAGFEAGIARFIGRPMMWAKHSRKKLLVVGFTALLVGLGFIMIGGFLFSKVTFNIFPPTKDSNAVLVALSFPPEIDIDQAQDIADKINQIASSTIGSEFVEASYYGTGSIQSATLRIALTPYDKRDIKAPEIVDQLKSAYKDFNLAQIKVNQEDVGPPTSPFNVRVQTDNRDQAYKLANDIAAFLQKTKLTRVSGEQARIVSTRTASPNVVTRENDKQFIEVSAEFEDDDTTTLVTLAQTAVEKQFNKEKLATYGFDESVLDFDFGQEDENQESFKTLALAFPIVLIIIFVLLSLQFRSLLQPILIFMAIPFSIFGITLGLYLTDNAFSFFAMLGFFALIGLSIKNTILVVDYANQARREGKNAVDAVYESLQERFRPLIATSFTAIVALIPLAILSPFWEGLAVVLIFGLLSSTFLVITVFPYYYLGAEFLRQHISRKSFVLWLLVTAAVISIMLALKAGPLSALALPITVIGFILYKKNKKAKLV